MGRRQLILEYKIPEGQAISFRVGGTIQALMQRTDAPVPDVDMRLVAASANKEPVTVEYEHALSGLQTVVLQPGTYALHQSRRLQAMGHVRAELGRAGQERWRESRETKGRRLTPPLAIGSMKHEARTHRKATRNSLGR